MVNETKEQLEILKKATKFKTDNEKLSNGNTINYKVTDDNTHYDINTPDRLIDILQTHRERDTRLRFYFGDSETGRDWEESYGIYGYIGRSTGSKPIPLILYNTRSIGGPSLLTDAIVKLQYSKGKDLIWIHPNYHRENEKE